MDTVELDDTEIEALKLIEGDDEIYQTNLWKELDVSSRKGSRIARSLEEKGLIEREEAVYDGNKTYLLKKKGNFEVPEKEDGEPEAKITAERNYTRDDLKPNERKALDFIENEGEVYQSNLWKELDVSSREGSRIAKSLDEKGFISREKDTYEGNVTYLLEPITVEVEYSLLVAGDMPSPFLGDSSPDPDSTAFTQWIMELTADMMEE